VLTVPSPAPATQVVPMAKQPLVKVRPLANVEVPSPVMFRFPADWMLWPALMKPVLIPANDEVALLAVSCPDTVVEPVREALPVTERLASTVAEPPALIFWVVVMNPVLVIPVWVEVPETRRFPVMLALVDTSRERLTIRDCKEEEAVVEVATNLEAVKVPAVTVSPCMDNVVPGVVVPMPNLPCSSILTLSVKEPVMFLVKKERKEVGDVVETLESTPLICAEEVARPDRS